MYNKNYNDKSFSYFELVKKTISPYCHLTRAFSQTLRNLNFHLCLYQLGQSSNQLRSVLISGLLKMFIRIIEIKILFVPGNMCRLSESEKETFYNI